jgi:tetratricopeptide (TPR) repeat protein
VKRLLTRTGFYLCVVLSVASPTHGQSAGFTPPTSEASVREVLEGHHQAPKADTYYLIALSEARKGNMPAAFKAINTGLEINSTNTRLLNLQGALLARQGRLVEARKLFLMVLNLSPGDEYAKTSLASVEHAMQPVRKVEPMLATPRTITPVETPASPLTAKVEVKKEERLLEADYFIEVKSKQECYHNMSMIKRALDSLTNKEPRRKDIKVQTLLETKDLVALPICPKTGDYSLKGKEVICEKHGKLSELGVEVANVYNEFNKGMRAKLSRNYLDALKSFEQVVILYPRWGEAHFQMGDTLFKLGETDLAQDSLRSSLKFEPGNLDAELLMANIYFKKGLKDSALGILDKITRNEKGTVYAYAARSIAKSIRSGRSYYEIFPPK